MDTAVASLEANVSQIQASSKEAADRLIVAIKKRHSEFQGKVKGHAEAGEAALQANFEGQVRRYFETVGKQLEQQQAAFLDVADAQIKAWRQAVDKLHEDAAKLSAARRADVDDAIKQMKAQAAEAEARLQGLKQGGVNSWVTLSTALAESRKAFDRAMQQASDAFKRASRPRT
jgi:hypothetical protein